MKILFALFALSALAQNQQTNLVDEREHVDIVQEKPIYNESPLGAGIDLTAEHVTEDF